MKGRFIAKRLNIINESWDESVGGFLIQAHCEVQRDGEAGGEAFIVNIASPERFALLASTGDLAFWGANYFVVDSPDEAKILPVIQGVIDRVEAKSWQELAQSTRIAFDWI